ncbi:PadR family transcriptional regulator [Microbacterium luteum]|uniref:PadR family transcriptional regulator n=1 Tax=Microbacterium luteum TaxID=2782167 RepID=UPI001E2B8027|nr:PadR family transcriptional regulator [Microbacterium luteum]
MDVVAREVSKEVSFWILVALSGGRKHGYAVLRDAELLSAAQGDAVVLKVPTLYAALERLARLGLVVAAGEEVVDGRARRYFEVSAAGMEGLQAEVGRLEARARAARTVMATPAAGAAAEKVHA